MIYPNSNGSRIIKFIQES